ncbi:MAG: hypothetical protein ACE5DX_01095 [Candidatus Dojkabacteria bacterium]
MKGPTVKSLIKKGWKQRSVFKTLMVVGLIAFFLLSNVPMTQAVAEPRSAIHTYVAPQGRNDLGSLSAWFAGGWNHLTATGSAEGKDDVSQKGAVLQIAALSDGMYDNPPASMIVWAQNEYNQILGYESITVFAQNDSNPSTYFPGLGFELLRPILGFWQWTRNIAYGFFIVILIVIAFLVLFRQNLGGQTIVNVANSLPSVLIALLLVTLSYPISALFVDLVTIGTNFVQSVMVTAPGAPGYDIFQGGVQGAPGYSGPKINELQPDDYQLGFMNIWSSSAIHICDPDPLIPTEGELDTCEIGWFPLIGGVEETFLTGLFSALGGGLAGDLLKLLLGLVALGAAFKLFLALLNNYIILTTMPIFSPFIFLTAAIPGRTGTIVGNYFKTLLAASLVFIVLYGVFLFLIIVGNSSGLTGAFRDAGAIEWAPPLLGYGSEASQFGGGIYKIIVVYSVFLFSPSIPDLIKNNMGVPTGNIFFQVVSQRTTALGGLLNETKKRLTSYAPGTSNQG